MKNSNEIDIISVLIKIALWGVALVLMFPIALGVLALRLVANIVLGGVADKVTRGYHEKTI